MKAQRYFLLALFTLSALFTIDAAAQRVKPTLPEPATIEAGKFYYLFNEDTGLFMNYDYADSYTGDYHYYYMAASQITERTFTFAYDENSATYTIKNDRNRYFYYWSSSLRVTDTSIDSDNYWRMAQLPDGCYTIQHNYDYKANHYISVPKAYEGGRISATDTLNRKWRLIPADDVEATRMMLYMALENIDSTYCVAPYDEILSTATTQAELLEATKKVRSMKSLTDQYVQQSWSDYKIAFTNDASYPWGWDTNNKRYYIPERLSGEKTRLTAIVEVDVDDATLVYSAYVHRYNYYDDEERQNLKNELNVYIDGKLVRNVKPNQIANTYNVDRMPWDTDGRFCERLTKGVHTIEWEYLKCTGDTYNYAYISGVGVEKTPSVSVSLLEPGSLGTEILTQVNSVLDVRRLKIKGEMNADDWATVSLITQLFSIDLSEAVITEIPDNQFNYHSWLYEVSLPEGLIHVGNNAFRGTYIDQIVIPSTLESVGEWAFNSTNIKSVLASHSQLTSIGQYAFDNCRYMTEVSLPEKMKNIDYHAFGNSRHIHTLVLPKQLESLGTKAFYHCDSLSSNIVYPEGMTYVPGYCFQHCYGVDSLFIPNCVKTIGEYAFDICTGMEYVDLSDSLTHIYNYGFASCVSLKNIELPTTLSSISDYGFAYSGLDSIRIPENTNLAQYAFYDCNSLKYIELPTSYYNINNKYVLAECNNLEHIKIKSPTVLYGNTGEFVSWKGNVTVEVPDYLVNSYKLNTYWYTYKDVIGFGTSEVDTWTINNPVVLDASSRLQGTPNVNINYTTLTMQGETGMELQDLAMKLETYKGDYYNNGRKYYYNKFYNSSQILTSADIDVKGTLTLNYYTYGNHWAYIALPFDIKVGDIQTDAQYAIRYYDGTARADSAAAKGNWKNYAADDIVPAGTGFVYQTSLDGWTTFVAYDNASKSRAFSAKDLSAPLKANPCEVSAHRGWNLVGNPWMTWYNIHSVDFTAPITVYDQYNLCYTAYSIIDDDIALHPTQAFFVQCPEDVEAITFPARGRQLTSEIKNQNGAPALNHSAKERQLIDIQLIAGDIADKTRIVMNEKASLDYDYGSDASKFFADGNVMQLYTVGNNGLSYSINERPEADGMVDLAYIAAEKGEYTLSLTRNQASEVILTDLHTGIETDLTQTDYTFTSEAGTFTGRFRLAMKSSATGIGELVTKSTVNVVDGGIQATGYIEAYALDGRRIAEGDGFVALDKGVYVVRINNVSTKVIVK